MPKRNIWDFEGFTLCRLLGLSFDEVETAKIFKKFKIDYKDFSSHEMHQRLVQICMAKNTASKFVNKLLKGKFEEYEVKINGLDPKELVDIIERDNGLIDVPISALIWFAVRNPREDIEEIEMGVFYAVHFREHQALRFYDVLSRKLPDENVGDVLYKLESASKLNEKLKRNLNRSNQKREELKSEIDAIKSDKSVILLELAEQKRLNSRLMEDLERLGGEKALEYIKDLKREIEFLTKEIKVLNDELLKEGFNENFEYENKTATFAFNEINKEQGLGTSLKGMKVAFIGGVESLIPRYREVVEYFGGDFYYHCGRCSQGRREIDTLVNKTDVVFCPVDINSHNACRYAKKACKLSGKPCYFLRSSSLTTLKNVLIDFAGNNQEVIVDGVSG